MSAYVDANVFFLGHYSHEERGERARAILQKIQSGEHAYTCSLTLDEVMWAVHKQKHGQYLREVVSRIYATKNLVILNTPASAPMLALDFMEEYGLKPRDAIHAAVMRENQINTIYSDDVDFDKIKWMKRKF